jgi:hypothetical protein
VPNNPDFSGALYVAQGSNVGVGATLLLTDRLVSEAVGSCRNHSHDEYDLNCSDVGLSLRDFPLQTNSWRNHGQFPDDSREL